MPNGTYKNSGTSGENEFEIVPHARLRHLHIFVNNITYRNFHFHNEIELFAVISGHASVRRSGGSVELYPGDILILNSDEAHEINASGGAACLVFQLSNHFLNAYFPALRNTVFTSGDVGAAVNTEGKREIWEHIINASLSYIRSDSLFELRCVSEASRLIELLIANVPNTVINDADYLARKKITSRMERLYNYIDANYQYPIRLTEVAEAEGITPTHLSHFFTENFGVSFQQYLNNIRFEHAVRLMDNPTMSVSDIAAASGFSDLKYMTRMFVDRFGCKPKEVREHMRGEGQSNFTIATPRALEYMYSAHEAVRLLEEFAEN